MWHGGICGLRVQRCERAPCRPNDLDNRLGRTLIGSALPKVLSHSRFDENDEIDVYHEILVLAPARPVSRRNHGPKHQIRPLPPLVHLTPFRRRRQKAERSQPAGNLTLAQRY